MTNSANITTVILNQLLPLVLVLVVVVLLISCTERFLFNFEAAKVTALPVVLLAFTERTALVVG